MSMYPPFIFTFSPNIYLKVSTFVEIIGNYHNKKMSIYVFRITHINNISHIAQYGITHESSPNRNPHFQTIGDGGLIRKRTGKVLFNGKRLGDYIPFYFSPKMPMLYVICKGYNNVPKQNPE